MKMSFFSKIIILSCLSFCMTSTGLQGQEKEKKHKEKKEKSADRLIWVPVLASNPANGFMVGVAPSRNWLTSEEEGTSYSSVLGSFIYTTKNQFLFTAKGTVFGAKNEDVFMTDVRYFITSQPTFGLGTGDGTQVLASDGFEYEEGEFSEGIDEAQMMKFNFLRLYGTYFKKVKKVDNLYAGLGLHFDYHYKIQDQLLDLDTIPPVITSDYAYSVNNGFNPKKYTTTAVSGNLMYDTRDNPVSPYKGVYSLATFKVAPSFVSSKGSTALWLEFRSYFNLNKERERNILAFWTYGNFQTSGHLPYLDLPALGWDQFGRSGRGYPQGRFRGEDLVYSELEWRFPLQKEKNKWGGVIFANATSASNRDNGISIMKNFNTAAGVGLRYMLREQSRTNICLDFGMGNNGSKGFYLSVNEVF